MNNKASSAYIKYPKKANLNFIEYSCHYLHAVYNIIIQLNNVTTLPRWTIDEGLIC